MPVSVKHSHYDALKAAGVGLASALKETWVVHLIRLAEEDPEMIPDFRNLDAPVLDGGELV
jgi:sulfopyruvate decarboxylase subunit alpha